MKMKSGSKGKPSMKGLKKAGTVGISGITKKRSGKDVGVIDMNPKKRMPKSGAGKRVF
jgi:hypothetical protein